MSIVGTVKSAIGKTSDACDSIAGYISFAYTIRSAIISLIVFLIASLISKFTKGSIRIQADIREVELDTHVLHDFPDALIAERHEKRSRRVKRGKRYVTEQYDVTLYDVSNFISPDGERMNKLRSLTLRPVSTLYPVRLRDGNVNGGTVLPPSKFWNPCSTVLHHKDKMYAGVQRPHDGPCSTLVGKGWDVYLQEDGSILTQNAGAYGKAIAQIVGFLAGTHFAFETFKLVLLVSNGFYAEYKLPDIFKSELGDAGKLYKLWWTRAYKADAGENCLDAVGDIAGALGADVVENATDAASGIAKVAERVTETVALAYLSSMAHASDMRNVDTRLSSVSGKAFKIMISRVLYLCVFSIVMYLLLKQYIFTSILKVEEGNDRPTGNYVLVAVCTIVMTIMLRKYAYILHSASIRKSFKQKVLEIFGDSPLAEDFKKRFHSIDHARIAI